MRVIQNEAAWREGFKAGETGKLLASCPYRACDSEQYLGWLAGFIEGKAARAEAARQAEASDA